MPLNKTEKFTANFSLQRELDYFDNIPSFDLMKENNFKEGEERIWNRIVLAEAVEIFGSGFPNKKNPTDKENLTIIQRLRSKTKDFFFYNPDLISVDYLAKITNRKNTEVHQFLKDETRLNKFDIIRICKIFKIY